MLERGVALNGQPNFGEWLSWHRHQRDVVSYGKGLRLKDAMGMAVQLSGQACALSVGVATCSRLSLPNGADGAVFLFQGSCVNVSGIGTVPCKSNGTSSALLVHGVGDLKDANGQPLYSPAQPAQLVVLCLRTLCTHPDGDAYAGYTNQPEELAEDVAANPLRVIVDVPQTVTGDATICTVSGAVDAGKFFCLDPARSGRDAQGNYVQVLDFYGDILGGNR